MREDESENTAIKLAKITIIPFVLQGIQVPECNI